MSGAALKKISPTVAEARAGLNRIDAVHERKEVENSKGKAVDAGGRDPKSDKSQEMDRVDEMKEENSNDVGSNDEEHDIEPVTVKKGRGEGAALVNSARPRPGKKTSMKEDHLR